MTGPLYVYESSDRYALVRSPKWADAAALLNRAEARAQWSRIDRGWLVRRDRLGDLLALAEHEGWQVRPKGRLARERLSDEDPKRTHNACRECGHVLTAERSVRLGLGPVCRLRIGGER